MTRPAASRAIARAAQRPARATFLTGRYAHHTGVDTLRDGEDLDEPRTIATMPGTARDASASP